MTQIKYPEQSRRIERLIDYLLSRHYIDAAQDLTTILSGNEKRGKDLISNLRQGKQKLRRHHVDNLVKKFPFINPNYLLHGTQTLEKHEPAEELPDEKVLHEIKLSPESKRNIEITDIECIQIRAKYEELSKMTEWLKNAMDSAHRIAENAQELQKRCMPQV